MIVECPHCRARYRLDPARLRNGRGRLQCVKCRHIFPVAAAEGEGAEAPESLPGRGPRQGLDVAVAALPRGPFRQLVVGVLARCGARSVPVDDGLSALEVARRTRPRLVVLHAELRGLTGPEVARTLRDEPTLAQSRLLLLGGPPPSGRWAPSPARVHSVDAWLPDGASVEELEPILRLLLDRSPRDTSDLDDDEVRAWSRIAATDLLLCERPLVDSHLAGRGLTRELLVGPLRGACLERFPVAGSQDRRAMLAILDAEVDAALNVRRGELAS